MNYHNYEGKIVEKYGVELKGWPSSKTGICNPASLGGRQQLEILLAALESGQCHWVVLSEDELEERKRLNQAREERGEQVYRPRKSANHHSNPRGAQSLETIDDDDDEELDGQATSTTKRNRNNEEDDGDDGEQGVARKRSRTDDGNGDDQDNEDNAAIDKDNRDAVIGDDQDNADDVASDDQDNAENSST